MKELIDKFKKIEKEISNEKGDFSLFALFLREDSTNKWDLLVSADWIQANKSKALNLIASKVQSKLNKNELVNLSRIVIIEDDNPALDSFHKAVDVKHGIAEMQDSNFFGLDIKHAYIITSLQNTAQAS